jgi:hypothetical protein
MGKVESGRDATACNVDLRELVFSMILLTTAHGKASEIEDVALPLSYEWE